MIQWFSSKDDKKLNIYIFTNWLCLW